MTASKIDYTPKHVLELRRPIKLPDESVESWSQLRMQVTVPDPLVRRIAPATGGLQ